MKIINETTMASGRFAKLVRVDYTDEEGMVDQYEAVKSPKGVREAVDVVAILCPSNDLIIVKQYRPPVDAYVIEFPAGIRDEGETNIETAIRELKEETGYTVTKIIDVSPQTASSPGIIEEFVTIVQVEVDETDPINQNVTQNLDENESIDVMRFHLSGVCENNEDVIQSLLDDTIGTGDYVVGSRLFAWLSGMTRSLRIVPNTRGKWG